MHALLHWPHPYWVQVWEGVIRDFLVVLILFNWLTCAEHFWCSHHKDSMTHMMIINIFKQYKFCIPTKKMGPVRHPWCPERDVNLQCERCHQKARIDEWKLMGSGSFLGDKWMWESVTKNWVSLINTVAVRKSWPVWQIKASKTQGTAGIPNKKAQSPSLLHLH